MPRWTEEARLKQAEIQKSRRSWRASTGPKTEEGKAASARNALKHGHYTPEMAELKNLLREQNKFLKSLTSLRHREQPDRLRGDPEDAGLLRCARNLNPSGEAYGSYRMVEQAQYRDKLKCSEIK